MQEAAQSNRPTLLPLLRYRDPKVAIAWLGKAFGFETRCVAAGADGSFAYAHLACGDNLIMVTPAREALSDKPAAKLKSVKTPAKLSHLFFGQACYLLIEDIDAHCKRAKDAGAEIVHAIAPYEHGGRRYACRDLEGHVWTFGTYDPWHEKTASPPQRPRPPVLQSLLAHRAGLTAAAVLTLVAVAIPLWRMQTPPQAPVATASEAAGGSTLQVAAVTAAEDAAINHSVERIRDTLDEEKKARRAAEASQRQTLGELETERAARQEAERAAEQLRTELSEAHAALAAAERRADDVTDPVTWETQAVPASGDNLPSAPTATEVAAPVTAALSVASDPAPLVADPTPAPGLSQAERAPESSPPDAGPTEASSPESHPSQADLSKPVLAKPRPVPSNPLLAEGQAAMANGDIETVRRHFRRLAAQGLPEAALALGSTYDPVSVERAGLASAQADRAQAKQWYRRAIELAQAATERRPRQ